MADSFFPRRVTPSLPPDTPWMTPALLGHLDALLSSYSRLLRRELILPGHLTDRGMALWKSSTVVVTHGLGPDPTFVYGNLAALDLFAATWSELTHMKSRESAEPISQPERERLLREVTANGYINNYAGVRRALSGRRFRIEGVTVWEVTDTTGRRLGQAAAFDHWTFL